MMENDKIVWGFDLTDFGSEDKFLELCRNNGLNEDPETGPDNDFSWTGDDLELVTSYNPLVNKGYASYMGITGSPAKVHKLVENIRDSALHIKGESSLRRDFI